MATITLSDGTPLYYEIEGWDNPGPPILFLNGMSQSTLHWKSHIRHFEKTRKVIAYNARGQGGQPTGGVPLSLRLHADDLVELIDALSVDRVQLAGFSHGARVALGFAAYHPKRVERLMLVSATNRMTVAAKLIIQSWIEILSLGGIEAMTWASLPMILGKDFLDKHERMIPGIIKASLQRNSEEGLKELLRAMQTFPVLEELTPSVTAKTIVLSADQDPLVEPDGARELARQLSARHVLIENCGHTIPVEVPQLFQSLVSEFFSIE